ncbi:rhomboid family intramembrane serine protease [Natronomonas salina]|uniref:rhomboid family intramembrane serine protease n=1 Tax=Natronomonas salina TaxID=1710540 RepID=UPI0015B444DC|nr:rhomboid family intramembrane serine protease [Natronomonas salina]QLD88026.1 rhomboid family intramembrane serine protease [Natronomonas salina]
MPSPAAVWYVVLLAGMLVSLATLYYLAQPHGRWGRLARRRLLLGLPWGTLVACAGVAAFYLFVQDGLANPTDPVVVPFRAWSYFYPTGILTAGFAHAGLGHLTGNLLGALVFGTVAEYAWGHFPRERGSASFSSLRTNPIVRAAAWGVGLFVAAILTAAFALGPVVGFSGVVFALVGFALVRYPVATVVAILVSRIVSQVFSAVQQPVFQQIASESFSRPWWANVAVQGHALGLFLGIVASVALLYRRDVRPKASHVWFAALAFTIDRGLWAIYTIESSDTYTLFRALGTALVFLLAALVAGGAVATPRDLVSRIDLSRREAAYGLLVCVLLALSLVGVWFNLFVVDDARAGLAEAEPTEVGDYTVFYAEEVENQFIPATPITGENGSDRVNASGVIVVSEERNIWWEEVSKRQLASRGDVTVRLGGLTWNADVRASRTTWSLAGGNSTYNVRLGRATAETRPVVYRAERASADVRIDGRNVSIEPEGNGFDVIVSRENETLDRQSVPVDGNAATVGGVEFERDGRDFFAERNETRIRVARRSD